jgi:CRISPR-associated protein Csx14
MAKASIPVDLFNPGQVFACLGFLEAADALLGDAEGGFDWSDEANVRFVLGAKGDENPFSVVLTYLSGARVIALAPPNSSNDTEKWQVPTEQLALDAPFPFPDPESPATLPAVLDGPHPIREFDRVRIVIDHWGDDEKNTGRDPVKFWGGAAGYPGAALARDALDLIRDRCRESVANPFGLSSEQSSSFRFDWRRDYIPIDIGFSLNSHSGGILAMGFPVVEILAAVGLGSARPAKEHRLEYRYGVLGNGHDTLDAPRRALLFNPTLLRAALGCPHLPFPCRRFRMSLGWPAKEGQARCITTVLEETVR